MDHARPAQRRAQTIVLNGTCFANATPMVFFQGTVTARFQPVYTKSRIAGTQ